ncbi:DNA phosphorothioation system sulfurtransferase DndC [Gammaproteobacteria bacterium]|nr:DNA phosphorothioation system sulfurtransferase DndC [Gammaproteobacteria bacterium]
MSQEKPKITFEQKVDTLLERIQELYLSDNVPWVIGYSGGKDSTAIAQLTWMALSTLDPKQKKKPVYVITTDTLVENPVVSSWVNASLEAISVAAKKQEMPFSSNLIHPDVKESFWVNLIGKGYPAPRANFRWCTDRLKIKPSNRFIEQQINENGEVILLLGVRRAESSARAGRMDKRKKVQEDLYPHDTMKNCLLYAPIEDWSNDEVWTFLMQNKNPWGARNQDLQTLYASATEDNECPVVVDTSTPSCGNSRFGCWVCTLVTEDKSMTAMVQNDADMEWMMPMLSLRNELDYRSEEKRKIERERRDFRRMSGAVSSYTDVSGKLAHVPGPYSQDARIHWLRRILEVQQAVRKHQATPDDLKNIELITLRELEEIRRTWLEDKRETEDFLPDIYEDVMQEKYKGKLRFTSSPFSKESLEVLRDCCENVMQYQMLRNLLDIENQYRAKGNRRGINTDLKNQANKDAFSDAAEALIELEKREEKRIEMESGIETIPVKNLS